MRQKVQPSEQVTVVRPRLDPLAPRNLPDSKMRKSLHFVEQAQSSVLSSLDVYGVSATVSILS
jgi:hypothetical protein